MMAERSTVTMGRWRPTTGSRPQSRKPVAASMVTMCAVTAIAFLSTCLLCFVLPAPLKSHRVSALRRSEASAATPAAATAAAAEPPKVVAKSRLLDYLDDALVASEVLKPEGRPTRGRIDEMILDLERLNPTDEPAYSELIDGSWKVKYSGSFAPGFLSSPTRELALFLYSGGFSLGSALSSFAEGFWGQAAGLKLGEKKVQIQSGRDVVSTAELEFGGQKQTLNYKAELLPLSSRRLSEEVVSLDLPEPLGTQTPPLELRRSILVTYLDADVMIARDESGLPEVLVRDLAEVAAAASPARPASPAEDGVAAVANAELRVEAAIGEDPMSSEAS